MRIAPELGEVTIVLVGNFNPVIFRPDWFARMGLLTIEQVDAANIEVVHPEITKFSTDWLILAVEKERFVVSTKEAPWIRLNDLVVRVFKEFLTHVPIRMMGINRRVHFSVKDEETREAIGRTLAPHEPWGEWMPKIELERGARHGGMRTLIMEQSVRDDGRRGYIRAKVEPTSMVNAGIFMEVNDHYEAENAEEVVGPDELISILESGFEDSVARSEGIIDQIMRLSEKRLN